MSRNCTERMITHYIFDYLFQDPSKDILNVQNQTYFANK